MKRFLLIAGTAALLMTSCSEEKFLNDAGWQEANKADKGTIEFRAHQPNMSRAALEDFTDNFGVFGIKTDDYTSDFPKLPAESGDAHLTEDDKLVFNNYLVGYYKSYPLRKNDDGMTETGGTPSTSFSSNWYYEGLGTGEYNYGDIADSKKSVYSEQYLKYWDAAKTYTLFVAYTPYENTTNIPYLKKGATAGDILQLKYPQPITVNSNTPTMVAARQELNADHIGTSETVPLKFNRIQPQIRIAFYEVIKGYKVKMINLTHEGQEYGTTAMPFDNTDAEHPYQKGSLKLKRNLEVNISEPTSSRASSSADLVCDFKYTVPTDPTEAAGYDDYDYINFRTDEVRLVGPNGNKTDYLKEERANKAFSPTVYNVFSYKDYQYDPVNKNYTEVANTPNDFQFVLSFELEAEDTKEVITVRNARVNVPSDYVKWEDNCLYTYIFKITKNTKGTTSDVEEFNPFEPDDPGTDALYPIVFDQLTVADLSTEDATEYTLYDNANNPTATNGFIFQSYVRKDFTAELKFGETLDLKNFMITKGKDYDGYDYKDLLEKERAAKAADENYTYMFKFKSGDNKIASVSPDGKVSPVAPGTTTIYVEYTHTKTEEDGSTTVDFVATDAVIVNVKIENSFLSNAKWNFYVDVPAKLETMLIDDSELNDVTWTINGTQLGDADITTDPDFDYDATNKTLTFKKVGEKYFCKAVKTNGNTDFFYIFVKNSFLNAETTKCRATESYKLNDYLKDSTLADKVTWVLFNEGGTTTPLTTASAYYTYDSTKNEITFKDNADGKTFVLQATNTDTDKTEKLTINVFVKNLFLNAEKTDCTATTVYNLNDYLEDSAIADKVTWVLYQADGSTAAETTDYTINSTANTLTFTEAAASKTFVLQATNSDTTPVSIEKIIITVKAAPAPATGN